MAIQFPTDLDNLANPVSTDLLDNASATLDHWTQHSDANDAIEALEAKVGVDGSAVTTSFDYKLNEVTSTDKAVGKTATQTLTNKTLTSPTITGATITTSTVNGVTLSSTGSSSLFLKENGTYGSAIAGDASYAAKGSVQGLTDAATSGLTIASGVISVNSGTSANNIVKLDGSAKLPAVDGSALTNLTNPAVYSSGTTTKNVADASGTQTIAHGLGKTLKYVRITAWQTGPNANGLPPQWVQAMSVYNGTTQSSMSILGSGSTTSTLYTTFRLSSSSGDVSTSYTTGVMTYDSTNISIAWTKTSSPTGTYTLLWEAFA